ncbi:MAG TPA: hypothetical protein VGV85_14035, partial [Longimicrobiaceae bacterium]|nr:hypothetical protein [Longimicrobiaceae bacterium]
MQTITTLCVAAALAVSSAGRAGQAPGRVCPDPARPCPGFRAHDLSFALPADGAARAEDRSAPFYALILRTAGRCAVSERERLAAQALFPGRKVFATRWECDGDAESNVTYTGVDARYGFLAVYAGASRAQADSALAGVRATGRFPGANLRRMRVVRVHP